MKIYLPWGYRDTRERYKTLYVQDGLDYLNLGKINEIVDAMIDEKEIAPIVMVLAPPVDRDKEYLANADFARAFATELVPAIDAKYRTKADGGSRAVMGSSLGGLISIMIAGQYPQVFANCAGQSSAIFADTDLDKLVSCAQRCCAISSRRGNLRDFSFQNQFARRQSQVARFSADARLHARIHRSSRRPQLGKLAGADSAGAAIFLEITAEKEIASGRRRGRGRAAWGRLRGRRA